MTKILFSPGKYIQGPGEINNVGKYAAGLGKKALILISAGGFRRNGQDILDGFETEDCTCEFEMFNGECSYNEIKRISALVEEKQCDLIIGVGGGKIFDTAKAVAYYEKTPVMICPTIASTDAPCSALSVIYTDEGVFEEYLFLPSNPNIVLLDTKIIAKSPVRLTMAGIGDAQLVNANEVSQNNVESDTNQENIVNEVKNTNISEQTQEDSYFDETRLEREKMYSQMLENYQKILETNNLSSDEKKNAQEEIKEINNEKNAIMIAENLVKTKGFKDIIIFKNNGNVTAIIKADKLEEKEISQLQNIITRELNVSINKINISKK